MIASILFHRRIPATKNYCVQAYIHGYSVIMSKTQVTIPFFVPHSGCPHRCVFCNQWVSTGSKTLPDAIAVRTKIDAYHTKIPPSVIRIEAAFFGGSFTAIPFEKQEELLGAALAGKRRGKIHAIRLSTRPDCIDHARLDLLERYEVETVELGAQSFSDTVLSASQRGHTTDDIFRAVELLRERKFNYVIQLMPGLPLDTADESLRSALTAVRLAPHGVRIYPTVVLEHTGLADMFREGRYTPLELHDAVELCAAMYSIFLESAIPVIRMGLHPLDAEGLAGILAGPYHPAFGFMVKSRFRRNQVEMAVEHYINSNPDKQHRKMIVELPAAGREEFIGLKKENLSHLRSKFPHCDLQIRFTDAGGISVTRD